MALSCLGLLAVLAAASPASNTSPGEPSPAEQARALLKDGRYEEAAAIARMLLSREEERTGPETLEVAEAVDIVVEAERLAGKVKDAEVRALAQRAIRIREERLGPDHPDVSRSVNNYANLLAESGDYAGALPLYERVLAIQERKLAPDDLLIAKTLTNLANLVSDMGDYDGSFPLYERALRIKEQALGPDDPQLISTLIGLAILERLTGEYMEARRTCERAVRIAGEKLRPGHPRRGATLATLASIAVEMGDDDEARRLLEQALALQIKELPPEHADIAASYGDLANLRRDAGDQEAARALYEKSLALQTASLEPESAYLVPNLTSLGQVLLALGDTAGARERLERGLRIRETQLGPEHPDVADSLAALADLRRAEGDLPGARSLLERALSIREHALGPVHPQTAESLARLAGISDGPGAIDLAHRAETIGRGHLRAIARELPERQALRYAAARPSGLDVELRIVAERPVEASIRTAWDDLIRGRALVLDEMAARHRDVLASEDRETRELRRRLAAARTQEAALWVRGVEGQDPASYRRVLDQARDREERLERELAEQSLDFRRERHAADIGLAEVARALPPRSALVAYARAARPQSAAGPGAARYLAFVLGPSGEAPAVVNLEDADRIDRLVADWRSAVAAEPSRVPSTARNEVRQLQRTGADLRAVAWDPVAPRVRGARRVFIVPDGALHLVNFAALPSGPDRYLVETAPPLHHLSAESDLAGVAETPLGTDRLLVVGGPDFDAARDLRTAASTTGPPSGDGRRAAPPPCAARRDRTYAPLPAAGREAAEIGAVWSRRRSGAADDILSLQGAEATKDRFIRLAPRYQVVHVATHAYFAGEACIPPGGPGPLANPLLLSGLVFAGANRREDSSVEAILTAEELASLDLSRVSWLVLSGCETGVGAIAPGEGVLGLRRAAQIAGARTLIMSLWSTHDDATRRWMSRLYERRLAGASTADAVRKASLDILEARRARGESDRPLYWGAFVAAGDWR
jgi:CHAT domain-containing protein/Tfp pilus assembly protein PilF